ncbi:MAG: PTS transporter subunit EIIC [Atopobium sp.]|nr:PTS transporter subunit EIIC [Atopobium sp.]
MGDTKKMGADILAAVGGKDNVQSVFHCMTRLRFTLKDREGVNDDKVKAVDGVMGVQERGGQYQVIVGPKVPEVYDAIVAAGVNAGGEIDENLDDAPADKGPLTAKKALNNVLDYLSGSVVPLIPVLITGGLFKTLSAIFGPTLLGIAAEDSHFIFLCNMVYNAAFYFMPIIAGHASAKKLGANSYLGAFMGMILIEPSFIALSSTDGASFSVYGIPAPTLSYAQTLIPVLLSVAVMAPVQKFFEKKLPESVRTVFAPFLTFVVMMPLALCLLAPLGNYIGIGISAFLSWLAGTPVGWLAIVIVAATFPALVLTGMHVGLMAIALAQYAAVGFDNMFLMAATVQAFTASGVGLAAWLRLKNPKEKTLALGYFITQFIGGVGEPLLYGIFIKYRRPWIGVFAGGAAAGLYAAITHVTFYVFASGLLTPLAFLGGTNENAINGWISMAIGMVVAFIVTWFFGFTKEQIEGVSSES